MKTATRSIALMATVLLPCAATAMEPLLVVEVRQPGELIGRVRAMLGDIGSLGVRPDDWVPVFLSPEVADDAARFEAISAALFEIDSRQRPRMALLLRAGDSDEVRRRAEDFLKPRDGMRQLPPVDGVKLFQAYLSHGPGEDRHREDYGPTFAYSGGMLLIGTDGASVASMLALAGRGPLIPETAPGEVAFRTDGRRLAERLDDVGRDSDTGLSSFDWQAFRNVVGPDLGPVSGRVRLDDTAASLTLESGLGPGRSSPLGELLTGGPLGAEIAAADGGFRLDLSLPRREAGARLVAVADAVVRATGTLGPLPGEALAEIRVPGEPSLLDRLGSLHVVVTPEGPVAVAVRGDAGPIHGLEGRFPEWLSVMAGTRLSPAAEWVDGIRVTSLVGHGTPWGFPIYSASRDGVWVVADDPRVAARLVRQDLFRATDPARPTLMKGRRAWGQWLDRQMPGEAGDADPVQQLDLLIDGFGRIPSPPGEDGPKPARVGFAALPPLEWSVVPAEGGVRFEFRQADVGPGIAEGARRWLRWRVDPAGNHVQRYRSMLR